MRILLVESENNAAAYLRKGLMENGFAVDVAPRSNDVLDLASLTSYDLLVCDTAARPPEQLAFRGAGKQTPVLFLTPRDGGQEAESHNYLRKPFAFSDFLTRVHSMLHGGSAGLQETLWVADLEVHLVRHRASRGGVRLDLTRKEFLLLSLLIRKAGEVLSRTLIADQVWEINFQSNTNFVDVHIRRLRAKVDEPFAKRLIHTVRGAGYVLEDRS